MNTSNIPSLLTGILLGAAVAVSVGTAAADKPAHDHTTMNHSPGSMELHRIMMQGHQQSMPMSGDVDRDFVTMMTMHHRQAIEMSEVLLEHGKNAELKAMAEKMKTEQAKEIEQLAPHKG